MKKIDDHNGFVSTSLLIFWAAKRLVVCDHSTRKLFLNLSLPPGPANEIAELGNLPV